ncbi:MAG: FtsX-like permease family protein [Thiolinea sp.]
MVSRLYATPLLLRASWRFFTRHPWQLWLTLLSIALGTAVIIAVDLANQSAGRSFQRSVDTLSGSMTHEIIAHKGLVPGDFYRQLRIDWGYRDSAPQLEVSLEKEGVQYRLLGIDPFALPAQEDDALDFSAEVLSRLLTEPGTVVVPEKLAERLEVQVGSVLPMLYEGQPVGLKVVALADLAASGDLILGDISSVGGLKYSGARKQSGLTRIQLNLSPQQAEVLEKRLPPTLRLASLQNRQQVFSQMTQAFSTNLLAMSLLAMLVGAFLVYNTMTFSVLQRRQTFATARMVGVTGGQLFRHMLLETLLLGLVGSVLGAVMGVVLAQALLGLVTQTISDLFVNMSASQLLVSPWILLKGIGITLLAVLIATLAPALEAARVQPVLVQRRSSLEQGSQRIGLGLAVGGVVLMLLSTLVLSLSARSLILGFVALFMLILGYSLCVPLVLRAFLGGLQWLTAGRWFAGTSLLWRMILRGVQASLSRTGLAIIALTVAVSATVGVSIMVGSFRNSVADWLEMTLSSDLYIAATPVGSSDAGGELHPDWMPRLRALPAVASVSSGRTALLMLDGRGTSALVLETGPHSEKGFELLSGDMAEIWPQYQRGAGLLVSEPFAYHRDKNTGDTVQMVTELSGVIDVPILGVFRDYSATQGMVSMPRVLYEAHWADRSRSSIGVKLKDSQQLAIVQQEIEKLAAELQVTGQPLRIRSNQEIREFSLAIFDRTFAITHVLRLLVIIVAFVGVFSALMALFLERGREFGILRATGFTPGQLRHLVLGQTALIGTLAGLLALPLGWMMADILIDIINRRSFGWTMQTYFFAWVPLQAVLLALVAALLAGIYPARRIGRLKVRESLLG